MVCGLSDHASIQVYRATLCAQVLLSAVTGFGLIPTYSGVPTQEYISWIEHSLVAVCVIATIEAIIMAILIILTPKGRVFIPRHRILIAILIVGAGIALGVRAVVLSGEGVPECATATGRRKTMQVLDDQESCQDFFSKGITALMSLLNGGLFAITAFVNPIKEVHEKNSRGNYGNMGAVYTTAA